MKAILILSLFLISLTYIGTMNLRVEQLKLATLLQSRTKFPEMTEKANVSYAVIIDVCGQTIYVFKYFQNKDNSNSYLENIGSLEEASFNLQKLEEDQICYALSKLLEFASENINIDAKESIDLKKVPIYLGITGAAPSEEPSKKLEILRECLSSSQFLFEDDWANLISSIDEGIYGWVSLNYFNGILYENEKSEKEVIQTIGYTDLGGKTFEVSFEPKGEIKEYNETVHTGKIDYNLYSYSYRKGGSNTGREKYINYMINLSNTNNTVEIPCFLKGFSETYEKDGKVYTLIGSGDAKKCYEGILKTIEINDTCTDEPCSMKDIYHPEVDGMKFVLNGDLDDISYVKMLNDKYYSPNDLFKEATKLCKKDAEQLKEEDTSTLNFSKYYCFNVVYKYTLLVNVLGLSPIENSVMFTSEINGNAIGWFSGKIAYNTGILPFN